MAVPRSSLVLYSIDCQLAFVLCDALPRYLAMSVERERFITVLSFGLRLVKSKGATAAKISEFFLASAHDGSRAVAN